MEIKKKRDYNDYIQRAKETKLEDRFGYVIMDLWESAKVSQKDIGNYLAKAMKGIFGLCGFLGIDLNGATLSATVVESTYIRSLMTITLMVLRLSERVCANANDECFALWFYEIVLHIEALAEHEEIDLWDCIN